MRASHVLARGVVALAACFVCSVSAFSGSERVFASAQLFMPNRMATTTLNKSTARMKAFPLTLPMMISDRLIRTNSNVLVMPCITRRLPNIPTITADIHSPLSLMRPCLWSMLVAITSDSRNTIATLASSAGCIVKPGRCTARCAPLMFLPKNAANSIKPMAMRLNTLP